MAVPKIPKKAASPKKKRYTRDVAAQPAYFGFATIDSNGIAPSSRVTNANDCYAICFQLQRDNLARDHRNSRIYKCYKMFAPTDYSVVAKKELMGLSNTPFGQMKYRIDNRKGTFFDMVAQRTIAAQITTKAGNERERKIYSDAISVGWNMVLNQWDSYYYNVNQDIEEMSLYGKGFEIAEEMTGWPTRAYHNSSILVPDFTFSDLTNLGEFCIKRSYTPLELWDRLGKGDKKIATEAGWNFDACIDALRLYTSNFNQFAWTQAEWLRQVAAGSLNLSRYYQQRINVFELIVREYDGSVSKMMVLQNYQPIVGAYNTGPSVVNKISEDEYREQTGFLYYKKNWVEKDNFKKYGWSEVIVPFMDTPGSGLFHEVKGFGESIFTQCRAYDIHMNRIMDAQDMNMRLMLKGGSAEATKKLKQMEWLPWCVLPEDCDPVQYRFDVPVERALNVMTYYMAEVDRGTGQYQVNSPSKDNKEKTATQAQLDAAENAKIRGTELSQYNIGQTTWNRTLFRRFLRTKSGGLGYELKERFEEFMRECKVPKEAYALENITDIQSMMLSGAGSVSFKLMASKELIALTGMTPANPGQEAAIRDGIAALGGVQNLEIYRPKIAKADSGQYRDISQENIGFTTPNVQSESLQVEPTDYHLEHLQGHFSDMMLKLDQAEARLGAGQAGPDYLMPLVQSFDLEGGHMEAHLGYLARDVTKQNEVKQLRQSLNMAQRRVDNIRSIAQKMAQEQQPQQMTEQDQKIQAKVAMDALSLETQRKKDEMKLGQAALIHQQRDQIAKDRAATELAIKRANAQVDQETQLEEARTKNEIALMEAETKKKTQENGSTSDSTQPGSQSS